MEQGQSLKTTRGKEEEISISEKYIRYIYIYVMINLY